MIRLRGPAWFHGLLAIAAVLAGALVGLATNIVTTSPRVWPAALAAVAFYAAVEVIRVVAALRRAPAAALTEASDPASVNPAADLTAVVVAHLTSVHGASAQPPARRDDGADPPAVRLRGSAQAGHLFTADWRPMLGDGDEFEPTGEVRPAHVEVPLLSDWLAAERSRLSAADVPDEIKSQLLRPIRAAQGQLRALGPDLSRLARAAYTARYTDAEVRLVLDRALSLRVNNLMARTDHPGWPEPTDLHAMAAFTLGCAEEELIELGFDAGKGGGGGCVAYVPRRVLLESPELMAIGEAMTAADATESAKLFVACQLAQDFAFIGIADQRRLWTHFVLPQAFARYPLDALIVDVGRIQRFGLP